jgi:hypothetical protein
MGDLAIQVFRAWRRRVASTTKPPAGVSHVPGSGVGEGSTTVPLNLDVADVPQVQGAAVQNIVTAQLGRRLRQVYALYLQRMDIVQEQRTARGCDFEFEEDVEKAGPESRIALFEDTARRIKRPVFVPPEVPSPALRITPGAVSKILTSSVAIECGDPPDKNTLVVPVNCRNGTGVSKLPLASKSNSAAIVEVLVKLYSPPGHTSIQWAPGQGSGDGKGGDCEQHKSRIEQRSWGR